MIVSENDTKVSKSQKLEFKKKNYITTHKLNFNLKNVLFHFKVSRSRVWRSLLSNARFPKKARKGKVIWKMDEDRQELEISQVDTQINEEAYEQNLTSFHIGSIQRV